MTLRTRRPGPPDGVSGRARRAPTVTAGRVGVGVVVGVALAALSGCSGDEPSEPADVSSEPADVAPPGSAAPTDARTSVAAGRVTGTLARARRADAVGAVGTVTDRWFASAYLGGDGPPSRVADAFPGFTVGAAAQAREDRGLTTSTTLGPGVEDVVERRGEVIVDLLATGGRAQAATARFALVMELTGARERVERVAGRLYLTSDPARRGPGWQVVGYDVERGRQR